MTPSWAALASLPPVSRPAGMRAAVLVPIYEAKGYLRLILTRRPDDMRTHAGDVVFPGGAIDPEDDGPVETALREAWEEVGLPPDHVEILGGLEPVSPNDPNMVIVPVVARVQRPAELIPAPDEVAAIIEPTIAELLDEGRWVTRMWGPREMWFCEFPEGTLWGATARMVRQLLEFFV